MKREEAHQVLDDARDRLIDAGFTLVDESGPNREVFGDWVRVFRRNALEVLLILERLEPFVTVQALGGHDYDVTRWERCIDGREPVHGGRGFLANFDALMRRLPELDRVVTDNGDALQECLQTSGPWPTTRSPSHASDSEWGLIEAARAEATAHQADAAKWIRLGRLLHEPGHQYEEAAAALNNALIAEPSNIEARYWLAQIYLLHFFDAPRAELVLRQALDLEPDRADCLSLLISARRDLGASPDELLELAERSVRAAPDWRTPREQLVVALIEVGRREAARQELAAVEALAVRDAPGDRLEAEYEESVTGRSRPSFEVWAERIRELLGEDAPHSGARD